MLIEISISKKFNLKLAFSVKFPSFQVIIYFL